MEDYFDEDRCEFAEGVVRQCNHADMGVTSNEYSDSDSDCEVVGIDVPIVIETDSESSCSSNDDTFSKTTVTSSTMPTVGNNMSHGDSSDDSFVDLKTEKKRRKSDDSFDQRIKFYQGIQSLPIFNSKYKNYSTVEAVTAILNAKHTSHVICSTQPYGCEKNSTFIVDLSQLEDKRDIRSDDLGSWRNTGVHTIYVSVRFDDNEKVKKVHVFGKGRPKVMRSTVYALKKTYWKHKISRDFSRRLFELSDYKGVDYKHCLLQYQFDGIEHQITGAPHGNSKRSGSGYTRTKSSVYQSIKKESFNEKPSILFDKMQGDVIDIESCGSVPRNRQQISNVRKKVDTKSRERDTLFAVMERCKREQSKSMPFIRSVLAAPESMCLLGNDRQLSDVERFCCNPKNFSVLGVDGTFNLGQFLVTITTYRHLLLEENTTGKPPVMIGPALIHQTKKTETYYALASGMVGLRPNLINLQAFGSDGEKAIGNAFSLQFHKATHLLCFLHVKRDIQRKLHDLGISVKFAKEYTKEIFGYIVGSHYYEGLVDCNSPEEFTNNLFKCQSLWNEREMLARDTTVPTFFSWFNTYYSDLMKDKMLKPVRHRAGLGNPPSQYTTNANESVNSRVKNKVDYKASELHIFCDKFEELVDTQTRNIERAFTIGNGPYRVSSLYPELMQLPSQWLKLSKTAKQQFLKRVQQQQVKSKPAEASVTQESKDYDTENIPPLSMSFDDSGLSETVYKSMWDKAAACNS